MNSTEILNKAKYIQFPRYNESYVEYNVNKHIDKLPIINDKEVLYVKMLTNGHHYTTEYHRNYVLPLLSKIFNFKYNINDFNLISVITDDGDLTYLRPKNNNLYKIKKFINNENNIEHTGEYEILINPDFFINPSYRSLYRYTHSCSRIINLNIDNDKKLFISGDSQMVPTIPVLSNYYKEIWYFDNRTGKHDNIINRENTIKFCENFKNVFFDDVLIELYTNPIWWYTEINLM